MRLTPPRIVVTAVTLGLLACGGSDQDAAAPQADPGATAGAPAAPAPGPDGPATPPGASVEVGRDVKLPAGFPDDVPTYPNSVAVASSKDEEDGMIVAFESKDAPDAVFEFYREQLVQQGWTLEGEMNSADHRMLIGDKDHRKTSVLVSTMEGKVEITVTVTRDEG